MARRTIKLWQLILAGPFLLWCAWDEYSRLDNLEQNGGTIYVGKFTHLLYTMGGKNMVLVVTGGFGILYIWLLFRFFRTERAAKRAEQPMPAAKAEPAQPEPAPVRPEPARRPPSPSPSPSPIAVERFERPSAPIPTALASDPNDQPKLLT